MVCNHYMRSGQVQQLCCFILAALSGGEDEDLAVKRQRRRAVEAGALEALCQAALAHPHEAAGAGIYRFLPLRIC